MKVLQINSVSGIRSTGRICTDLVETLAAAGDQGTIAYGRESVPDAYKKVSKRIGTSLDVYAHVIRSRLLDSSGFGSSRPTTELIEWIENYNPDVVHLHNLHGYYINIELLFDYLTKGKRRVVWTLHDCWPFTGHCAYFSFVQCDRWVSGCYDCPQRSKYPKSWMRDNSKENWAKKKRIFTSIEKMRIVVPSNWLASLVRKSFLRNYPISVIRNGIDLQVFKPTDSNFREQYGLENKVILLGVASVWDERKGYGDLLSLAELLDERHKMVLVGVNPKQISTLSSNIVAIPRTNSTRELAEIYSAADFYLNPTYEDNYPTTNLEAQACGTPVITYMTGGSPETLLTSNSFALHEKGPHALLESVEGYVFGKKAGNISDTSALSKDVNYEHYIRLYRDILSSS